MSFMDELFVEKPSNNADRFECHLAYQVGCCRGLASGGQPAAVSEFEFMQRAFTAYQTDPNTFDMFLAEEAAKGDGYINIYVRRTRMERDRMCKT